MVHDKDRYKLPKPASQKNHGNQYNCQDIYKRSHCGLCYIDHINYDCINTQQHILSQGEFPDSFTRTEVEMHSDHAEQCIRKNTETYIAVN